MPKPKPPKKPLRGRPPLERGEVATPIAFKVTAAERERYEAAAKAADLALSAWIRLACAEKLKRG